MKVAELRQQLDLQTSSILEWEDRYTHLQRELERLQNTTELECEKWKAREGHLLEQLQDLQQRIEVPALPSSGEDNDNSTDHPVRQMDKQESDPEVSVIGRISLPTLVGMPAWGSVRELDVYCHPAQQLPPLTKF